MPWCFLALRWGQRSNCEDIAHRVGAVVFQKTESPQGFSLESSEFRQLTIGYNDRWFPWDIAGNVGMARRGSPGQATLTYLLAHGFPGIWNTRPTNPSTGIHSLSLHLLFQKLKLSDCLLTPPCLLHHRHIPNPLEITTRQWLKLTGTLWELHFSLVNFSSNSRAKDEEPNWDGCLFTQTWELGTKRVLLLLFWNSK